MLANEMWHSDRLGRRWKLEGKMLVQECKSLEICVLYGALHFLESIQKIVLKQMCTLLISICITHVCE